MTSLVSTLVLFAAIASGCAARPVQAPASAPVTGDMPTVTNTAAPLPCANRAECPFRVNTRDAFTVFAGALGPETLATGSESPRGWPAVVDPTSKAQRLQIVCTKDSFWVSVYVDRGDLRPVTTAFVLATPTPRRGLGEDGRPQVGASLAPGTAVNVRASEGDAVQVDFTEESVTGSGWIPRSVIGDVYDIEMKDPRNLLEQERRWLDWEAPLDVLDEPHGQKIASVQGPVELQQLGEPRDGHLLAAINFVLLQRTYAVGWIPVAALATGTRRVFGGVLREREDDDLPMVPAPARAELHSAGGAVVGLVRMHTRLPCLAECEGPSPIVQLRCMADFPARIVRP